MSKRSALVDVQSALLRVGSDNPSGDEWTCPAHNDRKASLTVKYGDVPGTVILACGAGCKTSAVLSKLGLHVRELYDRVEPPQETVRKSYVYRDEDGSPLFRVLRRQEGDGSKRFHQQGVNGRGRGGWRTGSGAMKDVRRVLYRLPELTDAIDNGDTIHLTEGEKDADTLNEYFAAQDVDAFATCHPMGAGKWRADYTELLTGADAVVVWADRDPAGYRCAEQRLSAVLAAGIPARAVLPIPDHNGADAYDHVEAGFSPEETKPVSGNELAVLAGHAGQEEAADDVLEAVRREFLLVEARDQVLHHLDDVLYDEDVLALPPQRFVIDGWVPAGAYTGLYGPPGVGKTLVVQGMTRAVRKGTRWQDHSTTQGMTVSYVGEEVHQLQDRMRAWDARYPLRPDQTMEAGVTIARLIDLTKPEAVAAVIRTVRALEARHDSRVLLLTFDPLVEFMTGDENGEGMDLATRGLRALATLLDCAVVVGHHTNASEARARGADHLRMRCGAHIRMEHLDEVAGTVGLVQEKQRNAAKAALVLEIKEEAPASSWNGNRISWPRTTSRTRSAPSESVTRQPRPNRPTPDMRTRWRFSPTP